jgi:ADP-ribosylation factor-binding protein GGA
VELGGSSAKNDLSLIDFDDSDPSNGGPPGGANDLVGLFGSGPSTSSSTAPPNVNHATRPVSSHISSPQQQPQFGSIMLPGTPQPGASARGSRVSSPNSLEQGNGHGVLGSRSTVSIGMGMGSMSPQQQPQPQQQAGAPSTSTNQAKGKDPFADLVGLF